MKASPFSAEHMSALKGKLQQRQQQGVAIEGSGKAQEPGAQEVLVPTVVKPDGPSLHPLLLTNAVLQYQQRITTKRHVEKELVEKTQNLTQIRDQVLKNEGAIENSRSVYEDTINKKLEALDEKAFVQASVEAIETQEIREKVLGIENGGKSDDAVVLRASNALQIPKHWAMLSAGKGPGSEVIQEVYEKNLTEIQENAKAEISERHEQIDKEEKDKEKELRQMLADLHKRSEDLQKIVDSKESEMNSRLRVAAQQSIQRDQELAMKQQQLGQACYYHRTEGLQRLAYEHERNKSREEGWIQEVKQQFELSKKQQSQDVALQMQMLRNAEEELKRKHEEQMAGLEMRHETAMQEIAFQKEERQSFHALQHEQQKRELDFEFEMKTLLVDALDVSMEDSHKFRMQILGTIETRIQQIREQKLELLKTIAESGSDDESSKELLELVQMATDNSEADEVEKMFGFLRENSAAKQIEFKNTLEESSFQEVKEV